MKMNHIRIKAVLLLLFIAIPLFWNQSNIIVSAATPIMRDKTVVISGKGETYQLEIDKKVANSKYKWSTSKASVAKVSSKGLVTAVAKGTATIKCKVTYSNGKTKTLSTKVTVVVPATDVRINNAVEVNGAHIIKVGEKYDFNRTITPKASSDKTYWSVGHAYKEEDKDSISVDSNGVVTALKPGKVTLYASSAKNKELSKKREIYDSVIIEVVAPSLDVKTVEITNSNELKVVFDSAIDKSTVIELGNKLSSNIEIAMRKDFKGIWAKDPGNLTANLSTDGMTLTITPEHTFEGNYYVTFSNNIKSMSGIALTVDNKEISYVDTVGPDVVTFDLDDTGYVNTVVFTEPVDISRMKIASVLVVGSATSDPTTIHMLKSNLNYVLSEDKKTMKINMANISAIDYNKTFVITLSGITDLSGNDPIQGLISIYARTDSTPKPQAKPLSILRTGYKTVTVTFDRAIREVGYGQVNNGMLLNGTLDVNDNKKVIYTISDADAFLTGTQTFSIVNWQSYNVIPTDYSSSTAHKRSVDFTVEKIKPYLIGFEFDQETKLLKLTYNEPVTTISNTGFIQYKVNTITNEINSGTLTYTRLSSENPNEVRLTLANMTLNGAYTFTLQIGFVEDNFKNYSDSRIITLNNATNNSVELPHPYLVVQSATNLNQISVHFAHSIDVPSAQTISNYSIPGVTVLSAEVIKNTTNNGAEILLTVSNESITVTAERPMTISGIKGLNGSRSEMAPYSFSILLKDNMKPAMVGQPQYDRTAVNIIRINFNEDIQGTAIFQITQQGTVPIQIYNSAVVSGNSIIITLHNIPTNNSYLRMDMVGGTITDMNGNVAAPIQTTGVIIQY